MMIDAVDNLVRGVQGIKKLTALGDAMATTMDGQNGQNKGDGSQNSSSEAAQIQVLRLLRIPCLIV